MAKKAKSKYQLELYNEERKLFDTYSFHAATQHKIDHLTKYIDCLKRQLKAAIN